MIKSTLLFLLSITAFTYAQSSKTTATPTPTPSIFANNSREFYLRTDVIDKTPENARLDNLWLYSYHTGAGLGDAAFGANKTRYASKSWINYTDDEVGQLTFNLGTSYPWTMSLDWSSYRTWSPIYINVGQSGSHGFYLNDTGLQLNTNAKSGLNTTLSSFRGWLACNWWHNNTAQLFWRIGYTGESEVPCNCAEVYLCPEYI